MGGWGGWGRGGGGGLIILTEQPTLSELYLSLSAHLSVSLSVCLAVSLSVCSLSVYLSVCMSR